MILLDTLLLSPIAFVLRRIAEAVDAEMDDETHLREELLAAQMRAELGEITTDELAEVEQVLLARIRELRERAGAAPASMEGVRVTGVEASAWDDEPGGARGGQSR